eukprot:6194494-Pleurochrysis_carterae.AAC.1
MKDESNRHLCDNQVHACLTRRFVKKLAPNPLATRFGQVRALSANLVQHRHLRTAQNGRSEVSAVNDGACTHRNARVRRLRGTHV